MEERISDTISTIYELPGELCRNVAQHLAEPYSIAMTLSVQHGRPNSMRVSTKLPIWAHFVKFHDEVYLSSLSNEESQATEGGILSVLLYSPAGGKAVRTVYFSRDVWGVRGVRFVSTDADFEMDHRGGIWWQALVPTPGFDELVAQGDVSRSRIGKVNAC